MLDESVDQHTALGVQPLQGGKGKGPTAAMGAVITGQGPTHVEFADRWFGSRVQRPQWERPGFRYGEVPKLRRPFENSAGRLGWNRGRYTHGQELLGFGPDDTLPFGKPEELG